MKGRETDDGVQAVLTFPPTAEERFLAFHARHPEVYDHLVKLAREAKQKGQRKYGMKALFEILRWERDIHGLPDEKELWKLDNNFTAAYARLIMAQEHDLDGYFETRERKTA